MNSVSVQVLFPSGAKLAIYRNSWGLQVNVYTPRAKNIANEMGLCLYDWGQDVNAYGNNLRYKKHLKKRKYSYIILNLLSYRVLLAVRRIRNI